MQINKLTKVAIFLSLAGISVYGQPDYKFKLPEGITIPMILDYGEFNMNGERVFTLLPGLPESCPDGEATGIQAGPEFIVDMKWSDHKLEKFTLHLNPSIYKLRCQINYEDKKAIVELKDKTKEVKINELFITGYQSRIEEITSTLTDNPSINSIPITDRASWDALAGQEEAEQVLNQANAFVAGEKYLPNELNYLLFSQVGERHDYYKDHTAEDLYTLVKAECLTNQGKYLPAIEEEIKTYCGLRTWTYPAHDLNLLAFYGKEINIDLLAPRKSVALAKTLYILGDRLSPGIIELATENINDRILHPFRDMVEGKFPIRWWFTEPMNWNSHCFEGVTETALTIVKDPAERAFYIAVAEHYVRNYLRLYSDDGYCGEGVAYWNLGYGAFVNLAEKVAYATSGQVDFFELPGAKNAALFGANIRLYRDLVPSFSDCEMDVVPDEKLMYYIGRKLQVPISPRDYKREISEYPELIEKLPPSLDTGEPLPSHSYLDRSVVLISRPGPDYPECKLAIAIKGNHNGEPHNHNDVGSFHVASGKVGLLVDPGKEEYSAISFQNLRYTSQINNSFGHSVPVVAGKLQIIGEKARAREVITSFTPEKDEIIMDIKDAYDVPGLIKLHRGMVYERSEAGKITITDEAEFSSPQTFESALICFGDIEMDGRDSFTVTREKEKIKVIIDSDGLEYEIEDKLLEGNQIKDFNRIAIKLKDPVSEVNLRFIITPY